MPETARSGRRKASILDKSTWFYIILAILAAASVALLRSPDVMLDAVSGAILLFVSIVPLIAIGLFLGGIVNGIVDPDQIAPILGARSGIYGLILATLLGAITPGGPFAAFPLVVAIFAAGADLGAVIAFLTSWALIAIHRIIVWEIPLIGPDFVLLRVLVSLPMPILVGLIVRGLVRRYPGLDIPPPIGLHRAGDDQR